MRDLTSNVIVELEATSVRPLFLVSLGFADNTVYVWTGVGDLTWNGNTYKGVGTLGTISPIVETTETQAQGMTLTLSGIPTDLLGEALDQLSTSKQAQVYLGFLDATGAIVPNPVPSFIGLTDQPEIDISTDTCTISIAVENRLSDLQRARGGRYTDQDQRARHPGDGGLKYVQYLADSMINWRQK